MKHSLVVIILLALVSAGTAQVRPPLRPPLRPPIRIPRNVTGQYRFRQDEFRNRLDVKQLPGGKIKFQLVALWVSHNYPENIHNGELHGVVKIDQGVATYQNEDCTITMRFTLGKVVITESAANPPCGFGVNVTAAGSYLKVNSKNPKFDF